MTPPPLTLRDLARLTKTSKATVSRALNSGYGVSEKTRLRIVKAAAKHRFHLDPKIKMLMSHLGMAKPKRQSLNLAWVQYSKITFNPEKTFWLEKIWAGAQERAEELGFNLDVVIENNAEVSPERLSTILLSRGIVGLLELQSFPTGLFTEFDRSPFAVCRINNSAQDFAFDRSGPHHFHNTGHLIKELLALGYQRPAILFGVFIDELTSKSVVSRLVYEQLSWKPANRIPWLVDDPYSPEGLRALMKKWRPDVIICCDNNMTQRLKEAGFDVPKDIGVAHINLASDVPDWGGIDQNHHLIGAEAVDMLVRQINRGERGEPKHPKDLLITGAIQQGKTLTKQSRVSH
ncbi:MAG: LacI family DNA-binding transcriptional regulator [Blastochloris sp.]|nr:LacI family DNA-binding transcriptional regulator [Blastochloris sp.]